MGVKDPGYDEPLSQNPAPLDNDGTFGCVVLIVAFLVLSGIVALIQVLF